eukprot:4643907-Alexandrium_andersonii.AAC.1
MVGQAATSVRQLGHQRKVTLKTDNEPALRDLLNGMAQAMGAQALPEAPPAYEVLGNQGG